MKHDSRSVVPALPGVNSSLAPPPFQEPDVPLCVDLDGTLLRTDMLLECTAAVARKRTWSFALAPLWLIAGRARLKRELADRADLDIEHLPYNAEVVEFLRAEKATGRSVWLTTATDARLARAVADSVGVFDGVLTTEGSRNLEGRAKLAAISGKFPNGFDYIGDSGDDLAVWRSARRAMIVGTSSSVTHYANKLTNVEGRFTVAGPKPSTIIRALRVHQWAKNILLFVALFAAHAFVDATAWVRTALAFFSFGLTASAVYVINDLVDLEADRKHRSKRHRPFASGSLSIGFGLVCVPVLLAGGLGLALLLPVSFVALLLTYIALTLGYSLALKRRVAFDVLVLGGLYTLRIFAGGFAANIPISEWLAAFGLFFFMSLALLKRASELGAGAAALSGRGYRKEDREPVLAMGTASAYLSVLVLALYVSSPDVRRLYAAPQRLWALCPVVLYWLSRVWILAGRGEIDDDPVLFALKDRVSWAVAAVAACLIVSSA